MIDTLVPCQITGIVANASVLNTDDDLAVLWRLALDQPGYGVVSALAFAPEMTTQMMPIPDGAHVAVRGQCYANGDEDGAYLGILVEQFWILSASGDGSGDPDSALASMAEESEE